MIDGAASGQTGRKGRVGERVHAEILAAAADLFAERGPEASMGDLADAAGVGRTTLYRYFPSRESVLQALGEAALEELSTKLEQASLDHVPVEEALARAARAVVAVGNRFVFLLREVGPPHGEKDDSIFLPVRAVLERGRNDGALRDDVPLDWQVSAFGHLTLAAIELSTLVGVEDAAAMAAAQFLAGAQTPG
jgi:AcrR family transcriptional regulator